MNEPSSAKIQEILIGKSEEVRGSVANTASLYMGDLALLALKIEQAVCPDDERLNPLVSHLKRMVTMIERALDADWMTKGLNDTIDFVAASYARLEALARENGNIHPQNSPWVREQVYNLTGGKCAYCDTPLEWGGNGENSFFVEHVVPRAHGGPNNLANYVPACKSCNYSKHAHHVLTFIDRRLGRERPSAPNLTVVPKTNSDGAA